MEYEHKRDVESRIKKLESSLSSLENDLKLVQKKEAEVKVATEKASDEINRWKEEVKGMVLSHTFYVKFNFLLSKLIRSMFLLSKSTCIVAISYTLSLHVSKFIVGSNILLM